MITEELLSYIRKEITDGSTKEQITEILTTSGWTTPDIEEAFVKIGASYKVEEQADAETIVAQETKVDVSNQLTDEVNNNEVEPSSPVETASVDASQYNNIEVHKSKKWVIFTLVVLFISVIGAGSVYAYFSFYKKLTPYEVLTRMVKASKQIGTSKFNTDLSMNLQTSLNSKGSGISKVNLELKSKGSQNTTNPKDAKMDSNINININASYGFFAVNFELDLDMKVIDNVVYVRLNKVPNLPIPIDFSKIVGKWIKIDNTEFSKVADQASIKSSDMNKLLSNTKKNKEKIIAEMVSFVKGKKQIINRSFVNENDEKIGDVSVYHYVVKVSPDDVKTLFDKMVDIIKSVNPDSIDIAKIDKFKKSDNFNKMIDMLSNIDSQMWIGKKDFLPYKTSIKLNLVDEKFEVPSGNKKQYDKEQLISDNFNKAYATIINSYNQNGEIAWGNDFSLGICPSGSDASNTIFTKNKNISSAISKIRESGAAKVYCVIVGNSTATSKFAISVVLPGGSDGWCMGSDDLMNDNPSGPPSGSAKTNGECGKYIPETTAPVVVPKSFVYLNGDVSIVYSASDYGKPVMVTAPENSTSIKDIIKELNTQSHTQR